ncbi:AAA family ATPase [Pantoea dispersa]
MIVLDSVYAKNYKAYKEVVIDVSKFNVFIGKNSAGKSA